MKSNKQDQKESRSSAVDNGSSKASDTNLMGKSAQKDTHISSKDKGKQSTSRMPKAEDVEEGKSVSKQSSGWGPAADENENTGANGSNGSAV